jgi:nucleotide-binding universal stress UspA family protein
MDQVQRQVDDVFWTELNEAGAIIPTDVPSTSTLRIGDAAEEILKQVRSGTHDLVVIGSRGRGNVESHSLGSVSQQVSRACSVPVLIVHGAKSSPLPELDAPIERTSSQNGDRPLVSAAG